eukprot:gene25006-30207_t
MEINERKKAKQAYLESLAKQKACSKVGGEAEVTIESSNPFRHDGAAQGMAKQTKREQLLEEKRKAFFEQQQNRVPLGTGMTEVALAPQQINIKADLFAPAPQQQPLQPHQQHYEGPSTSNIAVTENKSIKPAALEEPKLSNWKKLGYPSEYAYAKDLGMLNDTKRLPNDHSSSSAAQPSSLVMSTANDPYYGGQTNTSAFSSIALPSMPLPSSMSNVGGYSGYTGGSSVADVTNNVGRPLVPTMQYFSQQSQTALAAANPKEGLKGHAFDAPAISSNQSSLHPRFLPRVKEEDGSRREGALESANTRFPSGGFHIGEEQDVQKKRDKQAEYAAALEFDKQRQPDNSVGNNSQAEMHGRVRGGEVGESSFGGFNGDPQLGQQQDAQKKRDKQAEYAAALAQDNQQRRLPQGANGGNHGGDVVGRGGVDDYSQSAKKGGFQLGAEQDAMKKREKQAEYAAALANDKQQLQHNAHARNGGDRDYRAQGEGLGLQLGNEQDVQQKKERQAEYAAALNSDKARLNIGQGHHPHSSASSLLPGGAGGSGLQFGHEKDKEEKRRQQQEYAQALQHQVAPSSHPSQGRRDPHSSVQPAGTGLQIGEEVDRETKRRHQAEYASQLQRQQQQQQHPQGSNQQQGYSNPVNQQHNLWGQPSHPEDKILAQQQYASLLDQQGHRGPNERGLGGESNGGVGVGGLQIGEVIGRDEKRRRQAEYAQALQQQQHGKQQLDKGAEKGRSVAQDGSNYPPQSSYMSSNPYPDPQIPVEMGWGNGRGVGSGNGYGNNVFVGNSNGNGGGNGGVRGGGGLVFGGADVDRETKRRQQAEYAQALQQQQQQHSRRHPANAEREAGGLDPSFTIGPLGIPVRREIMAGRRGVQKAFYQGGQGGAHSPRQVFVGEGDVGAQYGQPHSHHSPSKDLAPPSSESFFHFPDESEQKLKREQQARLLAQQIEQERKLREEAKLKLKEEERQLELKLERERREIQEAFEREEAGRKKKTDGGGGLGIGNNPNNDNGMGGMGGIALDAGVGIAAGVGETAKERARRLKQEEEEREERRLAKDREEIRRREEEEMRREREQLNKNQAAAAPPSPLRINPQEGRRQPREDLFAPTSPLPPSPSKKTRPPSQPTQLAFQQHTQAQPQAMSRPPARPRSSQQPFDPNNRQPAADPYNRQTRALPSRTPTYTPPSSSPSVSLDHTLGGESRFILPDGSEMDTGIMKNGAAPIPPLLLPFHLTLPPPSQPPTPTPAPTHKASELEEMRGRSRGTSRKDKEDEGVQSGGILSLFPPTAVAEPIQLPISAPVPDTGSDVGVGSRGESSRKPNSSAANRTFEKEVDVKLPDAKLSSRRRDIDKDDYGVKPVGVSEMKTTTTSVDVGVGAGEARGVSRGVGESRGNLVSRGGVTSRGSVLTSRGGMGYFADASSVSEKANVNGDYWGELQTLHMDGLDIFHKGVGRGNSLDVLPAGEGGDAIDEELRRTRTKWKLLDKLNNIHNVAPLNLQALLEGEEGASRPSSASGSTSRPSSSRLMRGGTNTLSNNSNLSDLYKEFGL